MTAAGAPPLADVPDLATWLGEEIPSGQVARAEYLLRQASARARRVAGQSWLDGDGQMLEVPDEVAGVVIEAAARVWLNPEGLQSETDSDYTAQRGAVGAEAGTVYFTEGQLATLAAYRPDASSRRVGLWTQPTCRDSPETTRSYAETDPFLAGWPGER